METITGVITWKPKSDPNFKSSECSALYTKIGFLKLYAPLEIGTWLRCLYDPKTRECISVRPIEPPISTRYFSDINQFGKFHLLFFGPIYKHSEYEFHCYQLGKVNCSTSTAKEIKDFDCFLAEYELSEETLQLTVKKTFRPDKQFTVEGEKYLKRCYSSYREYLDSEVSRSKDAVGYALKSLETFQANIMEEEPSTSDQLTAAKVYELNKSYWPPALGPLRVELVKRAYAFKNIKIEDVQVIENDNTEISSEPDSSTHVEPAKKFDFLVTSTRYTILNMLNRYVYWKPFQDKYLSMWMKKFQTALCDAGYKTPAEFFANHSDTFLVSVVDGQRILQIKDATKDELDVMLDLYKEIAQTRFLKIDKNGKKSPALIEVDNRMQFKNVFYR